MRNLFDCGPMRWRQVVAAAAGVMLLAGCNTIKPASEQLGRVAKDWSLAIRASQVSPVYPLTEDLQPGDVFVSQISEAQMISEFEEKGFLPFDTHVGRLSVPSLPRLYDGYPGISSASNLPRPWQFPADGKATPFTGAPIAGFPSYSFGISRGGGLNLAVPAQAVPIGLSLLGGDAANGTITLKETFTYGIPAPVLDEALAQFVKANAGFLQRYAPQPRQVDGKPVMQPFYLRIVHRVYLVRTIDVQLAVSRGFGGALSAGAGEAPQPLSMAEPQKVKETLDALNAGLAKVPVNPTAVGGSVQIKIATNRSVSLEETFARPLVFGYLATQCEIGEGGGIRGCGPELSLLQKGSGVQRTQPVAFAACDANCELLRAWSRASAANAQALAEWAARQAPPIAGPTLINGPDAQLRARAVRELNLSR
jgi:hypothetical protein